MYARLPALILVAYVLGWGSLSVAHPGDAPSSPATARPDTGKTARSAPQPRSPALKALAPNTLSGWIGGSVATGALIGNIRRATFGLLGVRYQRLLVPVPPIQRTEGPTLTYTADLFPLLLLSIPPRTIKIPPLSDPSPVRKRGLTTRGVGLSPAGLRLTYRVAKRVQPFIEASSGVTYFTKPIPNEQGKHVNFMFDVGVGVQIVLTSNLLVTAGYRYHHLSNGFRGQINPGVDANLFHFGVSVPQ